MRRFAVLLLGLTVAAGCSGAGTDPSITSADTATTPAPTTTSTFSTTTAPPISATSSQAPVLVGDLLVVGDWGSGTVPQGAVAGAMMRYAEENEVAAILTTGDNFYIDDWVFLMEPFGWVDRVGIPFWITWGNHDVESAIRVDAVNEAFDDPPRWTVHNWGLIDIIILDSNQITSPEQARFFLDQMEGSERATIVTMHHPPYSCAHHERLTELVDQVVEHLDEDVIAVLSGHEHLYQRFERDDVAYIITGGGGRRLYGLSTCPPGHPAPLAADSTHHYLTLEQDSDSLTVVARDVNNQVIDEFEIPLN